MRIVKLVLLVAFTTLAASMTAPAPADAACACSRVGVSNGYYANPSAYGSYGYGATYSPQQPQALPVQSKAAKSKKKAPRNKPIAQ
ncbi:MAG: hypothetical protein V2B18_01485 [Pseudomonadota bacterium]